MPTVRELVTKLSFQFNRDNLDKFEKSVGSFKKNIVTTAGDVAHFVGKIVDYFVDIGRAPIKLQNIAEAAGIAESELLAMRNAAVQFGVSTDNFDKGFSHIASMIQQAKRGIGPLFDIIRESGFAISQPSPFLNDLQNIEKFINELFVLIDQLPSKAEKIYALGKIFGPEAASEWLRVFEQGPEALKEAYRLQIQNTGEIGKQAELYRQFARDSQILANNINNLVVKISSYVLPTLNKAVVTATAIVEDLEKVGSSKGGFTEAIVNAANKPFPKKEFPLVQKLFGNQNANQNNANTINTTIEINVPPGTTEQQASYMADSLEEAMEDMFQYKAREIMNNNPQVE